jgi:SAM-dependent methyltransferase
MQAYGQGFARVYNSRWSGFAQRVAPLIHDFYAATPIGQRSKTVLDLCCGTGQLAAYFLTNGFRVVGIDLSEQMLVYAKENARRYLESGQARFQHGDVSDFRLDECFGLVVSTFDSLNHLDSEFALERCFQCVRAVSEGYFIFDLNTRTGLRRWNGIQVDDSCEDALIINRGIYDGQGERAWTKITGFARGSDGSYERFDETAFNTAFELEKVKNLLLDVGWKRIWFARVEDLQSPLTVTEAEKEPRAFVVASE